MKTHYIIVEHRQPELIKKLRFEIQQNKEEYQLLLLKYRKLEQKYGWETYLNNELCDLCRENNIDFRARLEHSKFPF